MPLRSQPVALHAGTWGVSGQFDEYCWRDNNGSLRGEAELSPAQSNAAARHTRKPFLSGGHRAACRLTVHHGTDALR
jgi:hypothetical protein